MKKIQIYVSHPIRGVAKNPDMIANCAKAIHFAERLRRAFPEITFFCPAEGEWKITRLWKAGIISVEDILWADTEQVKECDAVIIYDWERQLSSGMKKEKTVAMFHLIPVYQTDKPNIRLIKKFISWVKENR